MRILFSAVPFDHGKSGISVYCRHLSRGLIEAGHELTLILEKDAEPFFPDCRKIVLPRYCSNPLLSMLYHLFLLPGRIRASEYDFCILGAANRRALWKYPVFTMAVVHDLSQYHVRGKYDLFRMFYLKRILPPFVRKAHCLITVSKSTAADLRRFWHIPAERIQVIHNGLSLSETSGNVPNPEERYGIAGPCILYISRLEHPGKNHVNLIRAYNELPEELAGKYDLVLPGASWNGSDEVFRAAADSPRSARIRFPGFVPPDELPFFYRNAACYVFPSTFEGFGLSLLEAMHYGIPCACSRGSSLEEIAGGAALLFDPDDVSGIRTALEKLLTSGELRARLAAAGHERVKKFTWTETVKGFERRFAAWCGSDCRILGVRFHNCTKEEAVLQSDELIRSARKDGRCRFAAFINAHCLNLARQDPELTRILNGADAVWPDGSGIRTAGKILGIPIRDNVNGTDLFPLLCRKPYSVYLLGAAPGVAEQAAVRIRKQFPEVRIAGVDHGFFAGGQDERAAIDRVNRADPDLLLVAMGMPKQEKWIDAHRHELRCGLAIAVGGLFDFVSGRIPRAPVWMRRTGIEWLFRLALEPRRLFARYIIGNPLFIFRIMIFQAKNRK